MKALLGPTNYASQPVALMHALRERGIHARHVLYAWNQRATQFGYDTDRVVSLDRTNWLSAQMAVLEWALKEGFDVFHLWNRPLITPPERFGFFDGLDLPIIRAAGARTVYRFTGYDLRRKSLDMKLNPYSPLHSQFETPFDERRQAEHLDHLRSWVDCFVVQDPEMQTFLPEAKVIPRGIDLSVYAYVGVEPQAKPLIVHAPSNPALKGTEHVARAVTALRDRGFDFTFKLIRDLSHADALEWYRRADIVIDQLLIGWYGVLAMEGMALGKPVVAYVREPLYSDFKPSLPIVNATPDDLTERLAELIADPDLRVELGQRGRRFAEDVHDIRAVAEQMHAVYQGVVGASAPTPSADAHYLELRAPELADIIEKARHYDRWSDELPELRRKAKLYDEHAPDLPDLRARARQLERILPELRELRALRRRGDDQSAGDIAPLGVGDPTSEGVRERLAEIDRRARALRRARVRFDASTDSDGEFPPH